MNAVVRLTIAALVALAGLLGLPGRAQAAADVYTCTDAGNVWVVVNYKGSIRTGCAVSPSSGADALRQVAAVETANGMVTRIGGSPATIDPNPYIYWNYFHRDRSGTGWGSWVYSSLGAGAYQPKPGSIEGWTYGATGTAMNWSPPARPAPTTAPVTTQPAPAPATTAPRTTVPAATQTRATAGTSVPGQATATSDAAVAASATASQAPSATPDAGSGGSAEASASNAASSAGPAAGGATGAAGAAAATAATAATGERGSPLATVGTLAGVAVVAAAGTGVWWLRRNRSAA